MSASNIGKLSLSNRRSKIEISTTSLSRGEMFDRLLTSVTVSIYKLVKERMVDCSDEKIQAALESRAVLNLVKRHMRDENIEMVDEGDKPVFKRALSMIGEERTHIVGMESDKDFEGDEAVMDPNELRMRVTDQVVYEVVDAVKRHAGTAGQ